MDQSDAGGAGIFSQWTNQTEQRGQAKQRRSGRRPLTSLVSGVHRRALEQRTTWEEVKGSSSNTNKATALPKVAVRERRLSGLLDAHAAYVNALKHDCLRSGRIICYLLTTGGKRSY
eukprot:978045-Prorocentrum_minimum.AAC.2